MHVAELEHNLKGSTVKVALGQHTLIVGPNGAGKTAHTAALQLALSGTADINGKTIKSPQVLAQLGLGAVGVVARLTTESESAWGLERDGDTVKTPSFIPAEECDPAEVFPLRAVTAVLAGDAGAARARFVQWTQGTATEEDILALLPEPYHARYKDIAEKQQGSPVTRLTATTEYVRQRALTINTEIEAQKALVESLAAAVASGRPSAEEIEGAKANVAGWEAAWAAAVRFEAVADAQAAVREAQEQAAVCAAVVSTEAPSTPVDPAMKAMADVCMSHPKVLEGPGCPFCGTLVGHDTLRGAAAYYQQATTLPEPSPAARALAGWQEVQETREAALAAVLAASGVVAPPANTAEQAKANLDQWRAYLLGLEKRASEWDMVARARTLRVELEEDKPKLVAFHAALREVIAAVLQRGQGAFEERVQRYLPESWRFAVQLRDGDRDVFRVGFRRGAEVHTLLSGAETDALHVAIAMALSEGAPLAAASGKGKRVKRSKRDADDELRVIIAGDRDRDPQTLADLMRAWSAYPGQVIIESTHPPRGKFPAGWTLVEVERPVEEAAKAQDGESAGAAQPPASPPAAPPTTPPAAPPLAPAVSAAAPPAAASPQAPADDALDRAGLVQLGYSPEEIATMAAGGRKYALKYGVPRAQANRRPDGTWGFPPPTQVIKS